MYLAIARKTFATTATFFGKGRVYRHIPDVGGSHVVYGESFSEKQFQENFQNYHEVVMDKFRNIGLLSKKGGKLSRAAFVRSLRISQYGGGRKKLLAGYAYKNRPKDDDGAFQFIGWIRMTRKEFISEAYTNYCKVVGGDMSPVDNDEVNWGDAGIPLNYSKIRKYN